jgi:hypothetical protein
MDLVGGFYNIANQLPPQLPCTKIEYLKEKLRGKEIIMKDVRARSIMRSA